MTDSLYATFYLYNSSTASALSSGSNLTVEIFSVIEVRDSHGGECQDYGSSGL